MRKSLRTKVEKKLRERKSRRRWTQTVTALCLVVALAMSYALILPAITMSDDTYCGYEQHIEHGEAECFTETKALICELSEEGHTHSETCYEEKTILPCGLEENDGHIHSDSCYEEQRHLMCGTEESAGHIHTEECRDEDGNVICCLSEGEGAHHHDESCYATETAMICGLSEGDGAHRHGESCYTTGPVLVCELEESEPHVHGDDCYAIERKLTCTRPLHEHTLQCYSNPDADLETSSIWERAFNNIELSGNWNEDVISIAKTQIGYTESTNNYLVQEDGTTKKGYTRYGDWYGDPYGDWCAMFCSFCLHYAGIDRNVIPINANCGFWIEALEESGLYHSPASGYEVKSGDLIFFDYDADGDSDHVGFVYEVNEDSIRTIEGNKSNQVKYDSYRIEDASVLGYGQLPDNPNADLELQEKVITAVASDGASVTITGMIPEDAEARIVPEYLSDTQLTELFGEEMAFLMKDTVVAYDISIWVDGEEWQPNDSVSVVVTPANLEIRDGEELLVAHVDDEGDVSPVDAEMNENGDIAFAADSFSIFIMASVPSSGSAVNATLVPVWDQNSQTISALSADASSSALDKAYFCVEYSDDGGASWTEVAGSRTTSTVKKNTVVSLNASSALPTDNSLSRIYRVKGWTNKASGTSASVDLIDILDGYKPGFESWLSSTYEGPVPTTLSELYDAFAEYYTYRGPLNEAIAAINQELGLGTLAINGDKFNNYFYYGLVAEDSSVPFNNAQEYADYLAQLYIDEGIDAVRSAWNYYLYDLYDPDFDGKYDNSGDQVLDWPKANNGSFHAGATPVVNQLDYDFLENGVDYSNFVTGLDKSATTAAPGDGNKERKYEIDITADVQARIKAPVAMVLQIATQWHMFDLLHANELENADVGAVANNTELATLYDIKHALLRFVDYMENNYPGNNLVLAITETQHDGTYSMFSRNGLYVTNDGSVLRQGLIGWDIFGNCEHVHYRTGALTNACNALESNLSGWADMYGAPIRYEDIQKVAVIIGGPTENKNGTNGYACTLPWATFRSSGLNSVYGIRTNVGTPNGGAPVISWIDYSGNNTGAAFEDGTGSSFTQKYVASNEDAILATLIQIAEQEMTKKGLDLTATDKYVDNLTVTDTIRREFVLDEDETITATVYNKDGSVKETWEIPLSDPNLTIVNNADGTTTITYNFGRAYNTTKCVLHFGVVAQEDYIGSNNVFTNVGTPDLTYDHFVLDSDGNETGEVENYGVDCYDTPQVNVPIRYEAVDGELVTVMVGTEVDLGMLGDAIPRQAEDLLDNYGQINGTLSYTWILPDGTEISIGSVSVSNGVPGELPDISQAFTPDTAGNYTGTLKLVFTPEDVDPNGHFSDSDTAVAVSPQTRTGRVWIEALDDTRSITVRKVWDPYPSDIAEPYAEFRVVANGVATGETYRLDESNDWTVEIPDLPTTEEVNGEDVIIQYSVRETASSGSYIASYSDEVESTDIFSARATFTLVVSKDNNNVTRVVVSCTTADGITHTQSYDVSGLKKNTDYSFEMSGLPLDENGDPLAVTSYSFTGYNNKNNTVTINNISSQNCTVEKYLSGTEAVRVLVITNSEEFPIPPFNPGEPPAPYVPHLDPELTKQIDYLGDNDGETDSNNPDTTLDDNGVAGLDDMYRLYLNLQGDSEGVDLVLVLDASDSMWAPMGTTTRAGTLLNFLNGTNGENGFVANFLAANPDNQVTAISFGNTAQVILPWTQTAEEISISASGFTNYTAGLCVADEQLRQVAGSGNQKLVIFLGDGYVSSAYLDGQMHNEQSGYYVSTASRGGNPSLKVTLLRMLKDILDNDLADNNDIYIDTYQGGGTGERIYYSEATAAGAHPTSMAVVRLLRDLNMEIPGYSNGVITDRAQLQAFRTQVLRTYNEDLLALVDSYANAPRPTRNVDLYNLTKIAFLEFMQSNPSAVVHSIGFSSEISQSGIDLLGNPRPRSEVLEFMARYGAGEYHYADSAQTLAEEICSICFMTNTEITDTLSAYVQASDDPELKVVQTDADGTNEVVLYVNGAMTEAGAEILQSVSLDPVTGKIDIVFKPEHAINPAYIYTASFNVRVAPDAYTYFIENGYSDVGDPNTDYGNNDTSCNHEGFYSNSEGKVIWTAGGHPDEEDFPHPVIQVPESRLYELPHTGGIGTTLYILGGFGLMFASLVFGVKRRRRKVVGRTSQ